MLSEAYKREDVQAKIQEMGDVPSVELFARQKTPGWDTWGNELENDLELAA